MHCLDLRPDLVGVRGTAIKIVGTPILAAEETKFR